eukprot:TRINITY_DN49512_c0_g1_i4.p1 TRINITY_DN49512_c0_g1~~TRINITY_DN49512_c0_g1_i4.p1  ORF type:complete len:143 (-),score=22.68 TRINITY_DN49512_c0_g1_i4:276-704(-)
MAQVGLGLAYRFVALPVGAAWLVTYKMTEQGTSVLLGDDHGEYGYSRLAVGYLAGGVTAGAYVLGRESLFKPVLPPAPQEITTSWHPVKMARNLAHLLPPKLLRYYGVNFISSAAVAGLSCSLALKYMIGKPGKPELENEVH